MFCFFEMWEKTRQHSKDKQCSVLTSPTQLDLLIYHYHFPEYEYLCEFLGGLAMGIALLLFYLLLALANVLCSLLFADIMKRPFFKLYLNAASIQ